MQQHFFLKITPGGGVPADHYSSEVFSKYKVGQVIAFRKPMRPRNIKFHRLYFAALKFLFENQDLYSVMDDLREDITIALGHFTVETYRGKKTKKAKSISFAKMDEESFGELFDGFVTLACERIAPHLDAETFEQFNQILGCQRLPNKQLNRSADNG